MAGRAVPARHIHARPNPHVFALITISLIIFIERVPNEYCRLRREGRHAGCRVFCLLPLPGFSVNVHFFPFFEHLRLSLGQICLHRKIRLGRYSMSLCNSILCYSLHLKKIAAKPPLLSNRQMNTDWYVYDAVNYHITTGLSSTTLCRQSQSAPVITACKVVTYSELVIIHLLLSS